MQTFGLQNPVPVATLAFEVMEINNVTTLLYKSAYNIHEHEKVGSNKNYY